MGIGTGSAAIIGGIGAAGSLGAAAIGSSAANKAANAQAAAANHSADLQYQASQDALNFQKEMWATQQANLAPWLTAGTQGINTLADLLKTPGQGLLTPWTEQFQAPTSVTEQNDPGYAFRLAQGQQAIDRTAAARGGVLSGGTLKAQTRYGQDYASNEYSNVYSRALGEYQQRYNIFENNNTNTFDRLAALSGSGQTAATNLNQFGSSTANNITNNLLTTANTMGQAYQNAAAARASGYIGSANAWSQGLGGLSSGLMNMYLMQNMFGGAGTNSYAGYWNNPNANPFGGG